MAGVLGFLVLFTGEAVIQNPVGTVGHSARALEPCPAQPSVLWEKYLSSSVTILRERERGYFSWFKLVFL